jgi:hypothetical protein
MATPARLDATKVGSSGYWIERLGKLLDERARKAWGLSASSSAPTAPMSMANFDSYYHGDQPLAFASAKFAEAFGPFFKAFAVNICGVVVDSLVERVYVQGIRMAEDQPADKDAWAMWQANNLDAESRKAFRTAAVMGEVNWLVGPGENDMPRITVEDPLQSIVVVDNGRRVVALKRWYDANYDRERAFVYYSDRIEKFWRRSASGSGLLSAAGTPIGTGDWEAQDIAGEEAVLTHDLSVVPMVPMAHKPDLHYRGTSELADVTPIQDELNKITADMIVASEFGAYRQRWAIGIDIPTDASGNPDSLVAAMSRLWNIRVSENWNRDANPDPKVGEFGQTDLVPYIKAASHALEMAATIKRMPPHYLLSSDMRQPPSGETLRAAEAGLSSKARSTSIDYDDPLEEVFRLGFVATGDKKRAAISTAEIIWKDPETRTEAEHVDALGKLKVMLNVPDEILWERYGFSPQEIERIKQIRLAEQLQMTAEQREALVELIKVGYTPQAAEEAAGVEPMEHTGIAPTSVQPEGVAA